MDLSDGPGPLQRRVLLAAVVTMVLFFATAVTLDATGQPSWLVLPAMVLVWALVTRPLMRPVLEADRQRKALQYQAFLDEREQRRG